jgi:hypothetical protein
VYAPLSPGTLWKGAAALLRRGRHPEAALRGHLQVFYGADAVLLTDSGTTALSLALKVTCQGRDALLPAYGCYDLATAAMGAGVRVRLYDVASTTLGPDAASLGPWSWSTRSASRWTRRRTAAQRAGRGRS